MTNASRHVVLYKCVGTVICIYIVKVLGDMWYMYVIQGGNRYIYDICIIVYMVYVLDDMWYMYVIYGGNRYIYILYI